MRIEFNRLYLSRRNQSGNSTKSGPLNYCTPCDLQQGINCTCHTQSQNVAALFGKLAPREAEADVLSVLLDAIRCPYGNCSLGSHITTGIIGTQYVLPVLSKHNHS